MKKVNKVAKKVVPAPKKIRIGIKDFIKPKVYTIGIKEPPESAIEFVRNELSNVERQIDDLNTIASFLAFRLKQMEQND